MDDKVRETKRDYGEQDENGVDLAAIRRNLRLTPTERIEKMLRAARAVQELRRVREDH
jgi:hypothetical protein